MKKLIYILSILFLFSFTTADDRSIYSVPLKAAAVCAADYDLDGDMDVYVEHIMNSQTQWGGTYILQNDGGGHLTFLDSIFYSTGMQDVYADTITNSNAQEIVSGNGEYLNILKHEGDSLSLSRFYMGSQIHSFNLGDINGDDLLDVAFISIQGKYWGIIYNLGDGLFSAPEYFNTTYAPTDIAVGDIDNDGRDDIVLAGIGGEILMSNESGFESIPLYENEFKVLISDLDNDGSKDIITFSDINIMSIVHLYKNYGNEVFDTINGFNIMKGCNDFYISDFNNDDLPDLLFKAHYYQGGYLLYYNLGNFEFSEPQEIDVTYYGESQRSCCCADMDGNGYVDIVTTWMSFDPDYVPSILEIKFNDGQGNFVENPITSTAEWVDLPNDGIQCYPNPFYHEVTFEYQNLNNKPTKIIVYDGQGRLVYEVSPDIADISNNQQVRFIWDGKDIHGKTCPSGLYFVIFEADRICVQSKKLVKY